MGHSLLRWFFTGLVLSIAGIAYGQTLIAVDDNIQARAGEIHFEEEPGVLDNDTDGFDQPVPLTATAVPRTPVSHGTLALGLNGSFTYTPVVGYIGIDTFTYRVEDGSTVSNDATVTITVSGCEGGPALFTCWEESAYLAKLAELGYTTIQEGFEDDTAWGTARSPNTASSILSNGITWQSNFGPNGITTGSGPARTGLWGVYSLPHGDTSGTPTSLIHDGFTGTGSGVDTLVGVGGWIEGFVGGTLNFVITRTDTTAKTITFPDGSVGNLHKFFGVIDTAGFTTFEVVEVDGKVEQQLFIFGDDFTIATTSAVDVTAPQVTLINSVADTGDGRLSEDEVTGVAITELLVSFSEAVRESGGDTDPDDVTNPANYLLLGDGGDGVFDTISCLTGVDPGDVAIPVDGVTYVSGSQSEATLSLNGGIALVSGSYRLMVCGTTSIMDWSGNALDGDGDGTGGDDFTRDFTLNEPPVASADSLTTVEGGTVSMLDSFALSVLDNDTDAESDPLTATLVAGPSHAASFTFNPDGTFSYTHDGSEGSFDFFFYTANDNFSDSNTGTVSITITPVNDAPVADDQSVTTAEDTALAITLSASDVDSPTLTFIVVSGPSHGVLSGAPPAVTYQPSADSNGPDSFTFIANDGTDDSNVATVSITVTEVNDAPLANPDSYSTDEGGTIDTVVDLLPGVLSNDSDAENDTLTAILVSGPANAVSFTLNSDGSFFYTHDGGQSTSDQFTYKANDTQLDSNTTTVSIVIGGVNDAPVAVDDSLTIIEGGAVSVLDGGALSVLDNDTDAESDPLTAILISGPTHAADFTLNPDGTFSYTHDGSETITDQFTYKANDGLLDSNTATVSIVIAPVNDVPVANDQAVTTAEDTAKAITLTASDVDSATLTYSVVTGPTHGVLTGAPPALSYLPTADYNGPDSFTFIANDGADNSNVATVSITVTAINDAPVANPDSYSTDEGGTIDTAVDLLPGVLANDSDTENDTLTVILVSGPANAVSFTLNSDGSFFYTHDGGQSTSDQFTYKANDTLLDSNTTTVTIVIGGINDAPVAVDDSVTTIEGGTVTVLDDLSLSVLDNDTDAESDPLTAILVIGPTHAAAFTLNPDGTFSYTHDGSETIADQFTYKATDGLLDSNTATVSIVIAPVNDAPVANDQAVTTAEDTALAITLTASDVDSTTLTYSVVSGPSHGVLSGAPPALSYQPAADYNGPDTFTFIANDGSADSNVATVSITVTAINDAPVANPDSYSTDEGGTIDTVVDLLPGVLANDSDTENDTLTAILVSGPANAVSFTLNSDGSFFYTHDGSQSTSDQFTYKANDTLLDSNTTTVTIVINPVVTLPSLSIDDVSVLEGNVGTVEMVFTLSLSPSSLDPVEVDFMSSDGSATAGSDFGAVSGRAVFPAGVTTKTVTVMISGDTEAEGDETLYLNLANPLGAELGDDQGVGTIEDDDPWTWFAAPGGDDFNSCLSPAAPCLTIQAAVDKASSGDSVRVAPGTYMENVWIGIDLVLIAEVAGQSVIDGGGAGTVLTVAASTAVTISGLEVVNGGVGGVSSLGTMTLIDCWVHHNGDGLTGSFGGINSLAIGRIERCTISENIGSQEGGISNFGQLEVVNSTISGNTGSGVTNGGTASLESCSVIGNGSFGLSGGGQTNLRATIIAGHSAGNCEWPVTSLGHNLEDLDTCSFDLGMGDIFGSDPLLGPLADNGGLTPTHKPIVGSPPIDTGPESVFPASDQRGFVRPVDGDLDGVATSDIGAVEVLPPDPTPLFQDGFESGSTIEWSDTSP